MDEEVDDGEISDEVSKPNATLSQPTARPETPPQQLSSSSPSHRRTWGLRSPMVSRLSLYSDSSLSPLSPLRRQFSSPLLPSPAGQPKDAAGDADDELDTDELEGIDKSSEAESLTQDSKDVLLERLGDLVQHLTAGRGIQGTDITALHAKVDEMERLIPATRREKAKRRDSAGSPSLYGPKPGRLGSPLPIVPQERREGYSEPATPTKGPEPTSPVPAAQPSPPTPKPSNRELKVPSEVADRVVAEAEKLNTELTKVLENLKSRSIESDVRHTIFRLGEIVLIYASIFMECLLKEQRARRCASLSLIRRSRSCEHLFCPLPLPLSIFPRISAYHC